MRKILFLCVGMALGLAACENPAQEGPRPDLTIKIQRDETGALHAVAAPCPPWNTALNGPWSNAALPQFGCASAQNLAAMVANPADLIEGRSMGPANGTVEAAALYRYEAGKTKAFIDPNKKETKTVNTAAANPGSGSDK